MLWLGTVEHYSTLLPYGTILIITRTRSIFLAFDIQGSKNFYFGYLRKWLQTLQKVIRLGSPLLLYLCICDKFQVGSIFYSYKLQWGIMKSLSCKFEIQITRKVYAPKTYKDPKLEYVVQCNAILLDHLHCFPKLSRQYAISSTNSRSTVTCTSGEEKLVLSHFELDFPIGEGLMSEKELRSRSRGRLPSIWVQPGVSALAQIERLPSPYLTCFLWRRD